MDNEIRRPGSKFRLRVKGKGLAVVSQSEAAMEYGDYNLRMQVLRTLGFPKDYENADIEVLYRFSTAEYSYPLIGFIHKQLDAGVRFKAGDSLVYHFAPSDKDYTVEFRATEDENLLRAVILELDMRYQSLSTEEAIAHCRTVAIHEEELYGSYEIDDSLFEELDKLNDDGDKK